MARLYTNRCAGTPEAERIRRIGELFAKAAMLYWRRERLAGRVGPRATRSVPRIQDVAELVSDEAEKKIVRYLLLNGTASPRDISLALDVPRTTLTEKLARLRSTGLLTITGKTRAAHLVNATSPSRHRRLVVTILPPLR